LHNIFLLSIELNITKILIVKKNDLIR